jgi:hypothetical protein
MKRTIIITILFSLFSALSTYLLFDSMRSFKTEVRESKMAVKEMQEQVNTIENKYKSEIQYWVLKNNTLNSKIQKTETELKQSKQKSNSLQWKIQTMISESRTIQDTSDIVSNCDSLKNEIEIFIAETEAKDNLYESEIFDLKLVIQNKDSAFAVCEKSFLAMNDVVKNSLEQQTALADKLNVADKELKKQNRKTKFLSAAVFILSGATATLLLAK